MAMRQAVEQHYDGTVAFLASGSLSHRFAQNGLAPEFAFKIWSPFLENLDRRVLEMWQAGEWKDFCEMLPEYASKGHGEGFMHDTAMLLGALGWSAYDGAAEIVTPYFGASGTGQLNAVFPITPQVGFIAISFVVGVLVAVVSSFVPSRRTSRLDPIEVIQGG